MLGPAAAAYSLPIVLLAAIVGIVVFQWAVRTARLPLGRVVLFQLLLAAGAHFGGVLHRVYSTPAWDWHVFATHSYRHPDAIAGVIVSFFVFRPLVLPGVSIGLLADCLAPSIALALVVMRVGCFLAGCCFGAPTSLPWGIRFPGGSLASDLHAAFGWIPSPDHASLPVHPLELYFLALGLGVGVFCLWLLPRARYSGQVALAYLVLHEGGKFLLEQLRGAPRAPYNPAFSLGLALLAGAVLWWMAARRPNAVALRSAPTRAT